MRLRGRVSGLGQRDLAVMPQSQLLKGREYPRCIHSLWFSHWSLQVSQVKAVTGCGGPGGEKGEATMTNLVCLSGNTSYCEE